MNQVYTIDAVRRITAVEIDTVVIIANLNQHPILEAQGIDGNIRLRKGHIIAESIEKLGHPRRIFRSFPLPAVTVPIRPDQE